MSSTVWNVRQLNCNDIANELLWAWVTNYRVQTAPELSLSHVGIDYWRVASSSSKKIGGLFIFLERVINRTTNQPSTVAFFT